MYNCDYIILKPKIKYYNNGNIPISNCILPVVVLIACPNPNCLQVTYPSATVLILPVGVLIVGTTPNCVQLTYPSATVYYLWWC